MNPAEKRRGGASGGHVLRTGSSHPYHSTRQQHNNTTTSASSSNSGGRDNTVGPAGMPTVPPRAAVVSTTAAGEEAHEADGGVPVKDTDKEGLGMESSAAGGPGAGAGRSSNSNSSPGRTPRGARGSPNSRGKHRDATTPTAQQQQQQQQHLVLLRERDERIAALEREMAHMEREFTRELDKLSQSESETATFWQSKHSALNQQFLRTDTELRLLRSEVDVREAEREELRQGWEVLRRELKERDDEIRGLRGQVRGLKEWVSTSTRTDGQTSDEVFGDGMARLGNGLQNWVIVHFRKAKMDLSKVDEATLGELSELVPMFEELVHTSKVHLLQSIVSSILVEMVFNAYYVGLSEDQTSQFRKMEELLLSFTGRDEPVHQWRSSTLALIRREAPQRLSDETSSITDRVVTRINRILDAATTATSSEPRDAGLRALVSSAIDLARLLAVQKAVLRVFFPAVLPHQRVPFEHDTMEDMGGEDEDALAARDICCVAFPGVIKHGDESGGHLQYRNIITKARVLCSPED